MPTDLSFQPRLFRLESGASQLPILPGLIEISVSFPSRIVNFGNADAILREHKPFQNLLLLIRTPIVPLWPYPFTAAFVTTFMAFVTQIFLSYRILRLTKNMYIFGIAVALSILSLSLGLTLSVKTWLLDSILEIHKLNRFLSVWLATEVGVDTFIAGTLIYILSKSRTGFERSDTVINRLIRTSIQTGAICSACSILCLVLFLALPDTQMFALFGIPIARLYANTMLDTLLCRQYLRGMLSRGDSSSQTHNSVQLHVRKDIQTELKFDEAVVGTSSQSDYPTKYPQTRDSVYQES
ncbi:hypothetical protein B0H34DRAFT_820766 [Crassisporium funariophilum]|nr:hypothetical protein B0H34DRAFT_820766 [Crassisporium funariophilum]